MSSYIIGDVQGCFDSLQKLLKKIKFSIDKDRLFFLGDVVNRGNKSLETLSFIKDLKDNAKMVLGNHDFHLLACCITNKKHSNKDTFYDIVNSKNYSLIDFLLQKPLVIEYKNSLLVHAGIAPNWNKDITLKQSFAVHKNLMKENVGEFILKMYDNNPSCFSNELNELEKCRYTINCLTRMRFCKANGDLEFQHKLNYDEPPKGYKAWFLHKNRILANTDIFFGHWSTLTNVDIEHIYPMDTGCVWGKCLSAIRFEDKKIFSVTC
jgi:bis(5'-nucleosyl)-tetraphosphatase (symmetrical)